jgi:hypothetical protein
VVETVAIAYSPAPAAMPMAAFTQMVAAVVMPCTLSPLRMIAPAPRNPMPVTICAAMRSGMPLTAPIRREIVVKSADPTGDQDIGPKSRRLLANLALDANRGAEPGRQQQTQCQIKRWHVYCGE